MPRLLNYMYMKNLEDKIHYLGRLAHIQSMPDDVLDNCVHYVEEIFKVLEAKNLDNKEECENVIFSLVDIILMKHIKLAYLSWLSKNPPLDK